MPVDVVTYTRFLRAIGHQVVPTASAWWYDANPRFFLSAPPNQLCDPSEDEVRAVVRRPGCFGVRFAAPLTARGTLSYQIVCDRADYGLALLSANVRSKVRRGLKRCEVGPVPFATVAAQGRAAHDDTLGRQGRDGVLDGPAWDRFWSAAATTPGFEAWAARVGGVLAAFLVTVTFDDSVEFLLARSRSDELGAYPNNALLFAVTEEMLVRRRMPRITFGLESLEPVSSLDEFKFGMGYQRAALRQRIVLRPVVRLLLRPRVVRRAIQRWAAWRGETAGAWRKAAGVLRFAEASEFREPLRAREAGGPAPG